MSCVVVSVIAVLAAIAVSTFSCIMLKAKATSALAALKQIQTECAVKEEEEGTSATFVTSNLQGYEIESEGSNSCNGNESNGLISAIPNDSNELPTFILATNSNELTYSFRGETGTNFTDCLGLICGDGTSTSSISASFLNSKVIAMTADGIWDLHVADMDGDGDLDIVSTSFIDDTISWHENEQIS